MTDFMQAALDALELEHKRQRRTLAARAPEIRDVQTAVEAIQAECGALHITGVDPGSMKAGDFLIVTATAPASQRNEAEQALRDAGLDPLYPGCEAWKHRDGWMILARWPADAEANASQRPDDPAERVAA